MNPYEQKNQSRSDALPYPVVTLIDGSTVPRSRALRPQRGLFYQVAER